MTHLYLRSLTLPAALCLLLVIFSGCGPKKGSTDAGADRKTKNELIQTIVDNSIYTDQLSAAVKLALQSGDNKPSVQLDGTLKLRKDQAIQLSVKVPFFGTEAVKLVFTPDSVLLVDRINKQYVHESIRKLQAAGSFEQDFHTLQSLLSNHLFIPGQKTLARADYSDIHLSTSDNQQRLMAVNEAQTALFDINSDNRIIAATVRQTGSTKAISWQYDNFKRLMVGKDFPTKMTASIRSTDKQFTLLTTLSTVDFTSPVTVDAVPPAKYSRIGLGQLLKLVQLLL